MLEASPACAQIRQRGGVNVCVCASNLFPGRRVKRYAVPSCPVEDGYRTILGDPDVIEPDGPGSTGSDSPKTGRIHRGRTVQGAPANPRAVQIDIIPLRRPGRLNVDREPVPLPAAVGNPDLAQEILCYVSRPPAGAHSAGTNPVVHSPNREYDPALFVSRRIRELDSQTGVHAGSESNRHVDPLLPQHRLEELDDAVGA